MSTQYVLAHPISPFTVILPVSQAKNTQVCAEVNSKNYSALWLMQYS